jgi:transposase-like protein
LLLFSTFLLLSFWQFANNILVGLYLRTAMNRFHGNLHRFKWRHFQPEIILLCVRWYLRYPLSYRDLEEIMFERGLHVDHSTIYRWVQDYAPELEKAVDPISKPRQIPGVLTKRM